MTTAYKLGIEDIQIKTPGAQIIERILRDYESLDAFGEKINLYGDSVKQYLYSKNLGSGAFKVKLTMALEEDFHQLYITEEDQIKHYVGKLLLYKDQYNKKADVLVLERLKKICFEREMIKEYIDVCRVYALYYYNLNDLDRSIAYFDLVIDYLKKKEGQPGLILTMSELGLALLAKKDRERLQELIPYIIRRLEKTDDDFIHHMDQIYYNLGRIYVHVKKHEDGLRMFKKAERLTERNRMKAKCLIAKGNYELLRENYREAEAFYLKSKQVIRYQGKVTEDDRADYSLARLYYKMQQIKKAEGLMDEVIHRLEGRITATRNDYLAMYTQLKMRLRKKDDVLKVLEGIIDEEKEGYIYYLHQLNVVNRMVDEMDVGSPLLGDIKALLIRKAKEERPWDPDCLDKLKIIIGTIIIKE